MTSNPSAPIKQVTTVPFTVEDNYKKILWRGFIPVFKQIPTEGDFNFLSENFLFSSDGFNKNSPRICVDLEFAVVIINRDDRANRRWFLTHEFSFSEGWENYVIRGEGRDVGFCSWGDVIKKIKEMVFEEISIFKSHEERIKRLDWGL